MQDRDGVKNACALKGNHNARLTPFLQAAQNHQGYYYPNPIVHSLGLGLAGTVFAVIACLSVTIQSCTKTANTIAQGL